MCNSSKGMFGNSIQDKNNSEDFKDSSVGKIKITPFVNSNYFHLIINETNISNSSPQKHCGSGGSFH